MRLIDVGGGYPSLRGSKDDVSTFAEVSQKNLFVLFDRISSSSSLSVAE